MSTQQSSSVDRVFWTNFFGGQDNYKLQSKKFSLNKNQKKIVFDLGETCVQNYGCELEIVSEKFLILDIDYK